MRISAWVLRPRQKLPPGSGGGCRSDHPFEQLRQGFTMAAFEWNKIVAASLLALIIAVVSGLLAKGLVSPVELTKEAYPIGTQVAAAPAAPAENDKPAPLTADQLAKADATKGATIVK